MMKKMLTDLLAGKSIDWLIDEYPVADCTFAIGYLFGKAEQQKELGQEVNPEIAQELNRCISMMNAQVQEIMEEEKLAIHNWRHAREDRHQETLNESFS